MFGLTQDELSEVVSTLRLFPEVEEALIFGSRALGTYKKGSDVDLALKGETLKDATSKISGILNEESSLPYIFDLVNYDQITAEKLRDHIDRVGIVLYKK